MTRKLRVGFDLDGVLLYNPARIIRPIVKLLKHKRIIKRKELDFYIPKTKLQKFFWSIFHKSSLFLAPGYKDLKQLVNEGKIEAFLITGRFAHLKGDYESWLKKLDANHVFIKSFYNQHDKQPHKYKYQITKKLKLDIFVEDNYDIVSYIYEKNPKLKVFWISNIFDRKISYPYKFLDLKQALKKLQDYL